MSSPLLRVSDVRKRYPGADRDVVAGVSLDVNPGEWLAIMGRSGSGKSTLLHLIGGLDNPSAGTVEVAGHTISAMNESGRARVRRRHVGYVFQEYNLVDDLTAAGNIELALALAGVRRARRKAAVEILDRFGMADRADALPSKLSGGEQQRVALARALVTGSDLLLADEPTGALDTATAEVVVEQLSAARRTGRAIVMVTHDAAVAAAADRTLHLRDGLVVAEGLDGGTQGAQPRVDAVVAGVV